MARSLFSYSFVERLKLNGTIGQVLEQFGDPRSEPQAMREAISTLRAKVKQSPKEWLFWNVLGDYYLRLQEYVRAEHACQMCYELCANDPRSVYSLATVFRTLTNARHLNNPKLAEVDTQLSDMGADPIDPAKCQDALTLLSLSVDQAAEKSLSLFEKVLTLDIDDQSRRHVNDILAAMYSNFPELERKVKPKRKPDHGLFDLDQDNEFIEAADRFGRLRYLMNDPIVYPSELLEIIRLCQLAIQRNTGNGDAYVLLANTFALAAFHTISNKTEHDYFLSLACAVIYRWSEGNLWTRNKKIGDKVLHDTIKYLANHAVLSFDLANQRAQMYMQLFLGDAISPVSYAKIRGILETKAQPLKEAKAAIEMVASYNKQASESFEKGNYEQAIAEYTKAIELDDTEPITFCNRGNAFFVSGNFAQAIEDYNRALELDPEDTDALLYRGKSYDAIGELDKATVDFSAVIDLDPQNALAIRNRGIANAKQGNLDAAIADFSNLIDLDPDKANSFRDRALAYSQQGDYVLAIEDCTMAIDCDPDFDLAYYTRAWHYQQMGMTKKAIRDYEHYLALSPKASDRSQVEKALNELRHELIESDEA